MRANSDERSGVQPSGQADLAGDLSGTSRATVCRRDGGGAAALIQAAGYRVSSKLLTSKDIGGAGTSGNGKAKNRMDVGDTLTRTHRALRNRHR